MSESHLCSHGYVYGCAECRNFRRQSLVPPTADEDFATLLELHQGSPAPTRVAAFLRLYAGRIRKNERWDVPETMARSYESAAQALDNYMAAGGRLHALEALLQTWRVNASLSLNEASYNPPGTLQHDLAMVECRVWKKAADDLETGLAGLRADPAPPGGP